MNALKCDRCNNYYDYDPSARYNYISFGHKDIIPSKKVFMKDICPECMEEFMKWFYPPKTETTDEGCDGMRDELDNLKICNREQCKYCHFFGWTTDTKSGYQGGWYTCRMMNRKVLNPVYTNAGADIITPKTFLKSDVIFRDDDERVNNLYKEAEEISNNAGDTKEDEE